MFSRLMQRQRAATAQPPRFCAASMSGRVAASGRRPSSRAACAQRSGAKVMRSGGHPCVEELLGKQALAAWRAPGGVPAGSLWPSGDATSPPPLPPCTHLQQVLPLEGDALQPWVRLELKPLQEEKSTLSTVKAGYLIAGAQGPWIVCPTRSRVGCAEDKLRHPARQG